MPSEGHRNTPYHPILVLAVVYRNSPKTRYSLCQKQVLYPVEKIHRKGAKAAKKRKEEKIHCRDTKES